MSKKMLMLATTAAMIEQFNKNNILILEDMGYEVHVIGNWLEGNPISDERLESFKKWLSEHHAKWFHMPSTRKTTDVKNNFAAYKQVVGLINDNQYEFIHCHTPIGSVIGRLAAHKTHTKVIYTAHGFHFYKGAPFKNWLLYYPVERFLSRWTDILILINREDYNRARKSFHAKRTEYIPGVGVDTEKFNNCHIDKKEKCKSLGVSTDKFILLSVGELDKRKNQKVVIEALKQLNNTNIVYLIVGKGKLEDNYRNMIKNYHMEEQIKLLGFRTDIDELCKIANCFIHISIREGLGIAPLEAMASGLPLISSDINGMKDYTKDGITGCCINPMSVKAVCNAIDNMYRDKELRERCGLYNQKLVLKFDVINSMNIMRKIYKMIML